MSFDKCIQLYVNHQTNKIMIQNLSITLTCFLRVAVSPLTPPTKPWHSLTTFLSIWFCLFQTLHDKIIQYVSLSNIANFPQHSKFEIHQCCSIFLSIAEHNKFEIHQCSIFLFIAEQYAIPWMYQCLFVHPLMNICMIHSCG